MRKLPNILLIICIILLLLAGYAYLQESNKKKFFQNRHLELEFMRLILVETESNSTLIKKKYPDAKYSGNIILIPSELVLGDSFFKEHGYNIGKSDFFGYELKVNSSGFVSSSYLYKP